MLTVNVRFIATELAPGLQNGEHHIEDGTTVRELLKKCEDASGAVIPEKNLERLYPLFNSRPVKLETPLTDNGKLQISRVVVGG